MSDDCAVATEQVNKIVSVSKHHQANNRDRGRRGINCHLTRNITSERRKRCHQINNSVNESTVDMWRLLLPALIMNLIVSSRPMESHGDLDTQWREYKQKYSKSYSSSEEEATRFKIFQQRLQVIASHNQLYKDGNKSYEMSVNKYSDLSVAEFIEKVRGRRVAHSSRASRESRVRTAAAMMKDRKWSREEDLKVPESFDLRQVLGDLMPAPREQGTCGSCWAISAVVATEVLTVLKLNESVRYSVQVVTDCAYKVDSESIGCRGGFPESAIDFIIQYGLDSDRDYPTLGFDHPCRMRHPRDTIVKSYEYLSSDESELLAAVSTSGPLITEIYASGDAMLSYKSGVIDDTSCSNEIDHVALIVGYDNESWILQNSWGTDWGENGYFRVKRGSHTCGVALDSIKLITSFSTSVKQSVPMIIYLTVSVSIIIVVQ